MLYEVITDTVMLSFSERFHRYMKLLWKQRVLIALIIPAVIVVIIFKYFPMYGILIAFKNYKPKLGIAGSPWLDPLLKNFIRFFRNTNSWPTIWNTLKVGVMTMVFTFPAPIIFALLLNELKGNFYKRSVQTISYIPHFISVVVICSMLNGRITSYNVCYTKLLRGECRKIDDGSPSNSLPDRGSDIFKKKISSSIVHINRFSSKKTTDNIEQTVK